MRYLFCLWFVLSGTFICLFFLVRLLYKRRNNLISKREAVVNSTNVWGSTDASYAGVIRMRGLPFQAGVDDVLAFFDGIPLQREVRLFEAFLFPSSRECYFFFIYYADVLQHF